MAALTFVALVIFELGLTVSISRPSSQGHPPSNRNAIADAVADLGAPERIAEMFAGFQKHLCADAAREGLRPMA